MPRVGLNTAEFLVAPPAFTRPPVVLFSLLAVDFPSSAQSVAQDYVPVEPFVPDAERGLHGHAFNDDYYGRIHISPTSFDARNIAGRVAVRFNIWNAYLDRTESLPRIDGLRTEGVEIPGTTALSFAPLQTQEISVVLTPSGPARLDAALSFVFSTETLPVSITGMRGLVIKNPPLAPVVETLSWATDIVEAHDGSEQRRALRSAPRRRIEARFVLPQGGAREEVEALLYAHGAGDFLIPLWSDAARLAESAVAGSNRLRLEARPHGLREGESFLIVEGAKSEVGFAESLRGVDIDLGHVYFESDFGVGALIVSLERAFIFDTPVIERMATHDNLNLVFEFKESAPVPPSQEWEMYKNHPVFKTSRRAPAQISVAHKAAPLDYAIGPIALTPRRKRPAISSTHEVRLGSGAEGISSVALLGLFHKTRGGRDPFWLLDEELTLTQRPLPNASAVESTTHFFTNAYIPKEARRALAFETESGSFMYRDIESATRTAQGETLRLDSSLGLSPTRRVRIMKLVRLEGDKITITHGRMQTTAEFSLAEVA